MILWGQISQFSVFMVLQLLASFGKSGLLALEDKGDNAFIYLSDGDVDAISIPRTDHIMGGRLIKAGYVNKADLRKIMLASSFQGNREYLGFALMNSGKFEKKTICEAIREQAYENSLELSNWIEGSFRFNMPEGNCIIPCSAHIKVQHLLLETSRRLDEGLRPAYSKTEMPGDELCAYCNNNCSPSEKRKYLRDGICLWRNMPAVVREMIYSPHEEPSFPGEVRDEEEEFSDLPFL